MEGQKYISHQETNGNLTLCFIMCEFLKWHLVIDILGVTLELGIEKWKRFACKKSWLPYNIWKDWILRTTSVIEEEGHWRRNLTCGLANICGKVLEADKKSLFSRLQGNGAKVSILILISNIHCHIIKICTVKMY